MTPNEIHEIDWSLEQIQNHLTDIYQFLRSDPNYRPMSRRKFHGKRKPQRKADNPNVSWNTGCRNKRRRKPKRNKGKRNHWLTCLDNEGKRLPKVKIIFPSDDASDQIGTKYAHIPVGDKWVHAGCSVFVPRRVYRHFELVRRTLSDRMETLSRADPSVEW